MGDTPRCNELINKHGLSTTRNGDKAVLVSDYRFSEDAFALARQLERELAEARADCAATSYKLSEAFDELVAYELRLAERDKLIQQVEELLGRIDALEETLLDNKICVACLNPLDNCTCEAPL